MPAPTQYDLLAGYWKFDALDGGGNVVDSSYRGWGGILSNAGLVSGGKYGNALRTTTAAGKMSVVDDIPQRQSPTNRVSVNIWINLDKGLTAMWGTPKFFDKTGGTTAGFFLGCLTPGSNVVSFRVHNSAGTPYTASYAEAATSGWVMITGVYEGSVVRIYRNGVSQNTAAADGSLRFAAADIDNIGLGFEGLIDELSVWMRMLSAADVTALYAAGAGQQLILPETWDMRREAYTLGFNPDNFNYADADILATPATIDPDLAPFNGIIQNLTPPTLQRLDAPYAIIDSPRRIFVDPNPVIEDVQVDGDRLITATANAGPTDAATVTTWWQIEITPGMVFIVAERNAGRVFEENHDQTDDWYVPFGQNWRNLTLTFWMQANEDASQMWSSAPWTLSDPLYDNSSFTPSPLPPGPPLGPARGPTRGVPGPGVYRPRLIDRSRRR